MPHTNKTKQHGIKLCNIFFNGQTIGANRRQVHKEFRDPPTIGATGPKRVQRPTNYREKSRSGRSTGATSDQVYRLGSGSKEIGRGGKGGGVSLARESFTK